jgi:hypothetical protein
LAGKRAQDEVHHERGGERDHKTEENARKYFLRLPDLPAVPSRGDIENARPRERKRRERRRNLDEQEFHDIVPEVNEVAEAAGRALAGWDEALRRRQNRRCEHHHSQHEQKVLMNTRLIHVYILH